ncbi:MAG: DNA-directed RNA polymerase subunit omega [Clostridiales bacterium]|nr:DNA-directed RNA polymerase subunit omega [Clostridiales bacterium]
MINEPAVDTLIDRLGHEGQPASRYELCVVVAKRARQLIERNALNNVNENPGKLKEIALACEEIEDGKIKSVKD